MNLSVILPYFNAHETLDEAIGSVLSQSYKDFELILVDDGSIDHSGRIASRFAANDKRVRLVNLPHGGVVQAMNAGMAAARGEFIARMDADDIMHRDRLQMQIDLLRKRKDIGLVGCHIAWTPENPITDGMKEYIEWQNSLIAPEEIQDGLYLELAIANPTIMFRSQILEYGYFRDGDFPEDYEFQLRMAYSGVRMTKIPHVLHYWRDFPGRLTRTDPRYRREAFDSLRYQYLSRDPRLAERPVVFWGAGRVTRKRSNRLREMGVRPHFYIDIDPIKIGNHLNGIPVNGPGMLEELSPHERPFVLTFVSNQGARKLISDYLEKIGYRFGEDYLLAG